MTDKKRKLPELVVRDGSPVAVIISIEKYQEMLERLADIEDLKLLSQMRKNPLKFRKLSDFLEDDQPDV